MYPAVLLLPRARYCPYDDAGAIARDDFGYAIQVKENAPELLRRALSRAPVDITASGDYQAAEKKFGLSRQMLEACLELGFPMSVLERSPLVLRDLDLLKEINERARGVMMWSIIYTQDSAHRSTLRELERLAPPPEQRFAAMEQFARAGILTGTCMMPILPALCDMDENLDAVVRWPAEHGGRFVLAGGLTLADQQRDYFLGVLRDRFPDLLSLYERLYPADSYGAVRSGDPHRTGRRIRELCRQYGIADRIPRPIIPGDKRALNKRIVEALANQVYAMELENVPAQRIWAYRKAAWAIEDLEQDLELVYLHMGRKGLESIPNVGPKLAQVVEALIKKVLPRQTALDGRASTVAALSHGRTFPCDERGILYHNIALGGVCMSSEITRSRSKAMQPNFGTSQTLERIHSLVRAGTQVDGPI